MGDILAFLDFNLEDWGENIFRNICNHSLQSQGTWAVHGSTGQHNSKASPSHDEWKTNLMSLVILFHLLCALGESNGKLPPRTCPGCSMPEPYRSHDWALVPASPASKGWILMNGYNYGLSLRHRYNFPLSSKHWYSAFGKSLCTYKRCQKWRPLHSPFSPSLPLPGVTVCHHISNGLYRSLSAQRLSERIVQYYSWSNLAMLIVTSLSLLSRIETLENRPSNVAAKVGVFF